MLKMSNVDVFYSELQVLWDVNVEVQDKEIVALLGSNGAGKSTVMNTFSGVVNPTRGKIEFEGRDITATSPRERVELGISHVLERHRLFPLMTARENLLLGAYIDRARPHVERSLERVTTLFPFIKDRMKQLAGSFSGGEQQMIAIARGLMSEPKVIMLDEPFLGLSPAMVHKIIEVVGQLRADGMTVVFIEQHVRHSLSLADRAYILDAGRVAIAGDSKTLMANDQIRNVYMGIEAKAAV